MKDLKKLLLLVGLAVAAMLPAQAADYVFEYDGGYLYVTDGGAVGHTTTFSRSCVWTCVSNTGTLAAATLGTTSHFLYTEVNGTRYWLVGSTTNGQAVTVTTTAPGTAYWRNSGDYLYYYSSNNYYLYYRGNSWRTSRSSSTSWNNRNNNNYYEGYYGDYRSTTTAGTSVEQQVTSSTVSTPTITPSEAQTVEYGGSASYTASATGTQTIVPAHTTFTIGGYYGTTYHFYNNQLSTNANNFAVDNPVTPTYTWTLSGDGSNGLELMSTSGENTTVKYSASASGTTATLTVTATVGTATRTASVTINITPVEPTAISATGTTVYMGNSGEVAYSLTPDYAYHRVNVVSSSTGIFTVASPATSGSVAITPVAPGQATLTLTALNSNGSNGPSTSVNVTVRDICAVPEFAFAQSGSDVEVTLTSATLGATIRYTTDGTDPTPTTGTVYSGAFTVADGTTIKAIACKADYWDPSVVATKTVNPIDYVEQGVSGGIVTLNDLEDHTWSYYSNAECPIRSLGPADVKITYYGNGEKTVSTTNGTTPADNSWTANATGVKVNIGGEDENTFVYYKTLERYNGTTTDSYEYGNTAIYNYTTIPNPFQVRPTYGSGDTRWRGFYKWRIKSISNGHIYTAANKTGEKTAYTSANYNESNMLDAEETYYFVPDDEYDMEVELEAIWARAYVTTSTNNLGTYVTGKGAYERNFHVVTSTQNADSYQKSYPLTISAYYPDGSNGGGSVQGYTTGGGWGGTTTYHGFEAAAATKFENIAINMSNYTMSAAGNDLIIGRGCTGTMDRLRGLAEGSNSNVSYTLRVESGTINNFDMLNNVGGTYGGVVALKAIIGCDYDRATLNNALLTLAPNGTVYGKSNNAGNAGVVFSSAGNRNSKVFDWYVKSGTIQGSKLGDASADNALYLGHPSSDNNAQYTGKRYLTVEGGNLANIAGGVNNYATNHENYAVNDGEPTIYIRIKGGTVRGAVYGAGAYGGSSGDVKYVFTGGTINGWVAGGCNGTQNTGGELYGLTSIYIGGKTNVVQSATDPRIGGTSSYGTNGAYGGNIFGAGCGIQPAAYNASNPGASLNNLTVGKVYGSTVVIADESVVGRDVYGGGNFGLVDDGTQNRWTNNPSKTANLYILGGTVRGSVYGGSNNQNGQIVNITMTDGTIEGGLYGGSNSWGTINNDITMQIDGGQVGTTTQHANIHGGGYGSATRVSGNVEITLGQSGQTTDGVTVYGDVYGGSALGHVNGTTANNTYHTYVTLNKGTINGSLYGGALGDGSTEANVYGPVKVKVYGGSVKATSVSGSGAVYGCNNVNGKPQRAVTVDIYGTDAHPGDGTYAINAVYGGGNQAAYTYGTPNVTVHNCTPSIGDVYGGGNAASVPSTNVKIYGGDTIGNVYAGGNGTGVAANFVMVTGTADAYIYGGKIKRVFPGNNSSGIISGTKTVHVDASATDSDSDPAVARSHCPLQLGALFGGGNQASGTRGVWDIVCTGSSSEGIDTLFGGANNANITDASYTMTVNKGNIRKAIYGGNNAGGTVQGDITLDVLAPTGGSASCYNAEAWPTVFGGGFGKATATGGNVTVNIGTESGYASIPTINGNVYGGSALGSVNGSTSHTTTVNILNGHVKGHVFGGGLGHKTYDPDNKDANGVVIYDADSTVAIEKGNVVVNIGTASQTTYNDTYNGYNNVTIDGMVFGGNDSCGTPQGDVAVNIYHTAHTTASISPNQSTPTPVVTTAREDAVLKVTSDNFALKAVYGGGNLAHYKASDKKATVHIYGCENTVEFVYGGGNAADVPECELTVEGGHFYMIFGGGNGEVSYLPGANITEGDATTNVYGGVFHSVFGGSNTKGVIKGDMKLTVDQSKGECGLEVIGNLYGGGNRAESKSGNLTVECGQIVLGNVYGGANMASVTGDVILTMKGGEVDSVFAGNNQSGVIGGNVTLILNGGTIRNAFGGNNAGGDILGSITVNVDSLSTLGSDCLLKVDNVYGGGNKAAYTPDDATAETPEVNVKNGSVRNAVFGGGLGEAAKVTANPIVKVGTKEGGNKAMVGGTKIDGGNGDGNVFGGGSQADVLKVGDNTGNTRVILTGDATVTGNVYGGGNQANVEGNSKVELR